MHRHAIIRRWADLDVLNHVNNVRYAEWAKDALLAAQRDGYLPAGALWPATVTVTYRQPVLLSPHRIWIETTLGDDRVIRQAITDGTGSERVEYATIVTTLVPETDAFAPPFEAEHQYPVLVRRVETASDGRVDYPRMFEYFQEARIFASWKAGRESGVDAFVVGRVRLVLGPPLPWRAEAYAAHTGLGRLGRASVDLVTQIRDGDRVLAQSTATLVGYDRDTQTSRPFEVHERAAYGSLTPAETSLPHR